MSIQMKRSAINAIMRESEAFMRSFGFILPPFSRWSPDEMRARKGEIDGITGASLGWDITDFGLGDFEQTGLFLFHRAQRPLCRSAARTRHALCRKGDDRPQGSGDANAPASSEGRRHHQSRRRHAGDRAVWRYRRPVRPVQGTRVATDGIWRELAPGHKLRLSPGESVTLMPGDWHAFWGEGADVFVAEVSTVNDDNTDNIFETRQ